MILLVERPRFPRYIYIYTYRHIKETYLYIPCVYGAPYVTIIHMYLEYTPIKYPFRDGKYI